MNLPDAILGNSIVNWGTALGIAIASYVILRLARRFINKKLQSLAASTDTQVDDLVSDVLAGTRSFFLIIVSANMGARVLDLHDVAADVIGKITLVAFFVQAGIWISRGVAFSLSRSLRKDAEENPASVTMMTPMMFLARLVIWAVILLLTLDNLGVDVTALITGLGIGGIAVALALQTVLGDLFASLAIVMDKPFVIDDFISVGDFSGTIEHVGLKTTRVRSISGEQIVIGNSDLLNSRIRNFKRMQERRILFRVGVTYQTPHAKLQAIPAMIRQVIEENQQARFDRCHFKEFADSSLTFETVYYILSPDYAVYMETQQAINLEIYRRFESEGIEFAYPTQTLYLEKGEGGN